MRKPAPWLCECAITMREIRARINFGRALSGVKPMTMQKFYELRRNAAENFLAEHEFRRHGNKGLDRNPYLPDRLIGSNYIFKPRKANRLIRLGVAMKISNRGRRQGSRMVRGRVLAPA